MKNPKIVMGVVIGLGLILCAVIALTAASGVDVPSLPGITVKDDYPNGCVDCHKLIGPGKDNRLTVVLAQVRGHPDISKIVKTVPGDCGLCHAEGRNAPPLNTVIHKVHYDRPAENSYVTVYKGVCLNCHALDAKTGGMIVKSAAKNW
jgi:hypothetical protein